MQKKTVLFVSENVTLAQVVRLVVLAQALDPSRYDVHFACSEFPPFIFEGTRFAREPLPSVSRERMDRALHDGSRLYDEPTLRSYLDSELRLFDRVKPDLVVGDFRWTLTLSCPLRQIPHAALINAYWSPLRVDRTMPLPEHPIVRWLGVPLAKLGFPIAMPWVFKWFARPLDRLREAHGLPPFGDLPRLLTHADLVLYPEVSAVVELNALPSHHRFIGPVLWEPAAPPDSLPPPGFGRDTVYVTLGSSGDVRLLSEVVMGLESLDVDLLVATAGRSELAATERRFVRPYLPGSAAAKRSRLVVSNGGASTSYQALAEGRPVLGLPFNMDQYLAMQALERTGAARQLRSGTLDAKRVTEAAGALLSDPEPRERADDLARRLNAVDCRVEFRKVVDGLLS